MNICILSIGSELLEGSVVDTNSAFISSKLARFGAAPSMIRMVRDNKQELIELFTRFSKEYDLILTTGGLGPTFDDITMECLAASAGVELEFREEAYLHLTKILSSSKVIIRQEHKHQCMLPKGCKLYNNNFGTALGVSIELNNAQVVCMPGVPVEMKNMFNDYIMPELIERFNLGAIAYIDMHFLSIAESEIDAVIRKLNIPDSLECIINASSGKVLVKLRGRDHEQAEKTALELARAFPGHYAGRGDVNSFELLIQVLKSKGKTVSFAESCTGGLFSKLITDISGASAVFHGSIVSYDNSIKENVLGVSANTINTFGAVSYECALEMVLGVHKLMKTDYAVSITGIAGPTGAYVDKEVGLVYIGITDGEKVDVVTNNFTGSRQQIRTKSVNKALLSLINFIGRG